MNTTNHLISIATNLLLVLSFCLIYARILKRWIRPEVNEPDNLFLPLIFLSGALPLGIFAFCSAPSLKSMFEVEMSAGIDLIRFFEFAGVYAAIIACLTTVAVVCSVVLWKVLFGAGKSLKMHLDDRPISGAIVLFGLSIAISLALASQSAWISEQFIHFPTAPIFR